MSQPNNTQKPQPITQEVLQGLERECQNKLQDLNAAREDLCKAQELVINAQEALFKSYHVLSVNKEKYLTNAVQQLQTQSHNYAEELSTMRKARVREDNV